MLQVCVCVGSSCHLKGSYQIIQTFEGLIRQHQLEGKVELKASFCLGQCTTGVASRIGNEPVNGLTVGNAKEFFETQILKKVAL